MSNLSPSAFQTRENIKEAFWRLYKKKRIEKVTVSEICSVAGYNRSTFYAYFQNIYDVLDAIEKELISIDEFKAIIIDNLIKDNNFQRALVSLLALFEKCNEYFSVLLSKNRDPGFREKLLAQLSPAFSDLLPLGLTEKEQYALEYQNAGIILTIAKWYEKGENTSAEELIEILLDLTCNGTQTVLKKELINSETQS